MTNPSEDAEGEYLVLVNHEGQHSLWPAFREIPAGWSAVGPKGKRRECLDWIRTNWTDMRPKSLIDATTKRASGSPDAASETAEDPAASTPNPSQ